MLVSRVPIKMIRAQLTLLGQEGVHGVCPFLLVHIDLSGIPGRRARAVLRLTMNEGQIASRFQALFRGGSTSYINLVL